MTNAATLEPTTRYRVVATLALLWNLIGVAMFLMQVMMPPEAVAAMAPGQREVYEATPGWLNALFGIAVVGGTLGAIGLMVRRRWAVPAFAVSLAALVLQLLAAYLVTPAWRVSGPAGLVLPAVLLVIAVALLHHARRSAACGLLR